MAQTQTNPFEALAAKTAKTTPPPQGDLISHLKKLGQPTLPHSPGEAVEMLAAPWLPSAIEALKGVKPVDNLAQKIAIANKRADASPIGQAFPHYSSLPSEGLNAALGVPQRINWAQMAANAGKNRKGSNVQNAAGALAGPLGLAGAAALSPATRKLMGDEAYAAFHSNDPAIRAAAMKSVGADKLLSTDPRFRGKAQNFGVNTGFDILSDPLNFASAGTEALGEGVLKGMGKAGTKALASKNDLVRRTAQGLLTNVPEREAIHGAAVGTRAPLSERVIQGINVSRNKGIVWSRKQERLDEDLLARVLPQIRKNEAYAGPLKPRTMFPKELQDRLDMGDTGSEQTLTGLDLPPHPNVATKADKDKWQLGDPRNDAGEKLPPWAGTTTEDKLRRQLAESREQMQQKITADAMHRNTRGLTSGEIEKLAKAAQPDLPPGAELLRNLSRAQVESMLAIGIPHMRNVGFMGFLSMGERGLIGAAKKSIVGIPKGLVERLEEGGAQHFGTGVAHSAPVKALDALTRGGFRKVTTGALDRWDMAVRAQKLEELDRLHPEMDEVEKLDRVDKDIGRYNVKPYYVKASQGIGGNFPQWHGYQVPTAVGRALLRNPGRVHRALEYEQNANDAFLPNSPYRISAGGPIDEFASMTADPIRRAEGKYPSYLGSTSMLGPFAGLLQPTYGGLAENLAGFVGGLVPGGGAAVDYFLNPYNSTMPRGPRTALGLLGPYPQKRTPGSIRRTSGAMKNVTPTGGGSKGNAFESLWKASAKGASP